MNWIQEVVNIIESSKEKGVELDLPNRTIKYNNKIKLHRAITSFKGEEELVRAFLVNRLLNDLSYKAELIEIEKEYTAGRPKVITPRIDVILRDSKGNAFFFIEVKAPDKFEKDKNYIEGQLFGLAKLEGNVKYLVYYTIELQGGILVDKAIIIDFKAFPNYRDWIDAGSPSIANELPPQYNKPQKEPLTRGGKRDLVTSFNYEELKGLATNLHNVLWGGGGTGDTEVFSSLVNIILAKIQDEYNTDIGEQYKFQIFQYGNEIEKSEQIFERVNERYREALVDQLYITDNISDQFVINKQKFPLNKLIYTVGQLEKYSFVDGKSSLNGKDILGDFFEQIQREGFKQTKGQFFTPINIIRFILYALEIDNLSLKRLNDASELPYIIDPSCGSGTFLIEAMKIITTEIKYRKSDNVKSSRQVRDRFEELFKPDSKEHKWARHYLYGIEHNFDLGTAAKVNMILHGDGSSNIFVKDGLLPFRFYEKPSAPNYLNASRPDSNYKSKETNNNFDVVVSNPPFSVNLDNQTKDYLDFSFLFSGKKNSENLFIERYYQLLREGGRLGVVLPESIFDTSENKYMRLFIFKYFQVCAVVSLPQLTFEHYTSTKTSLLFAKKKTQQEVEQWERTWNQYAAEWERLKTRVENYIKEYILNEKKEKYPSIRNDDESAVKQNITRFLKITLEIDDLSLRPKDLLEKYKKEIEDATTIDRDLTSNFGFANLLWVFEEVSKKFNYPVFMASAENVGYKRTKRGEKVQPNELFDIEIAPNSLSFEKIESLYNNEIDEKNKRTKELTLELEEIRAKSRNDNETKEASLAKIKISKIDEQIMALEVERNTVLESLKKYYNASGNLFEAYKARNEKELLQLFEIKRLEPFKSQYILIREKEPRNILDFIRQAEIWK